MPDLDQRFRSLDRLDAPDVHDDIERRVVNPSPPLTDVSTRARVLAAVVAFAVFALAVGLGIRALQERPVDEPTPSLVPDPWADLAPGLTRLPDPPLSGDGIAVAVGDGSLLRFGGQLRDDLPPRDEGYIFDVTSRDWRRIASAPIAPRSNAAVVWTGSEFVVWGGHAGPNWPPHRFDDGAAYDPATDAWRALAPAPAVSDPYPRAVWTGDEMIVLRQDWHPGEITGLAYEVAGDRWRTLPPAPVALVDVEAVWTGTDLVVLGSPPDDEPYPRYAAALSLAPGAGWQPLPETDLIANSTALVWDGSRLVAMDYNNRVRALDPTSGEWSQLPPIPANQCEGGLGGPAVHEGTIVMSACGDLVALEPGAERWRILIGRGEPGPSPGYGSVYEVGGAFLVSGYAGERPILLAYRDPGAASQRAAWDVAALYASLRSNYPYEEGQVPDHVVDLIDRLASATALSRYEDRAASGLTPLWTYYWTFEVVSVEGDEAPFEVVIRLERSGDTDELLTIGPGVGADGQARDLVILDVEPADPYVAVEDGVRVGVLRHQQSATFEAGDATQIRCEEDQVAVPAPGRSVGGESGWLNVLVEENGEIDADCYGP